MAKRLWLPLCMICIFVASAAWGKVEGKVVEYRAGGTVLKGYLANNPKLKGKGRGC